MSFMDLFQHFPSQCVRYEKYGTLCHKSIFDRLVFPEVPVWMESLWKFPMLTRPSCANVMHQNFDCRIFPHLLMDSVQFIGMELYGMFTMMIDSLIPSSSIGNGVTQLRASASGISTPFLYITLKGWYGKLLTTNLLILGEFPPYVFCRLILVAFDPFPRWIPFHIGSSRTFPCPIL